LGGWSADRVRTILAVRGLAPLHRLGQHFLTDDGILERTAALVGDPRPCLEIGPGLGALTEKLVRRGCTVVALEIDRGLLAYLREEGPPGVRWVEGDARYADLASLVPPEGAALVGNLPYYLTSPLLRRVLPMGYAVHVFMVQKEVAQRLTAPPGDRRRSGLTVLCQAVGTLEVAGTVPRSAFYPQPDVDSVVVRLVRSPQAVPWETYALLETVLRAGFGYRRKALRHGLRHGLGWPLPKVEDLLRAAQVDPSARPEDLELNTWLRLAQHAADSLRREGKVAAMGGGRG
jgi:16S rRNA (adenine1518-N6/adenine1519-N6)-dimethyltransferase